MRNPTSSSRTRLTLGLLVLGAVVPSLSAARDRSLSFEDRVRARRAIERVYYSHQLGSRRPFEQTFRAGILEAKVRTYLRQSVALKSFWGISVSEDMVRAELVRMSRQTRMPERLRELYAALGDDPALILDCLARPALVDRLARNSFAHDQRIHEESLRAAHVLRQELRDGTVDPLSDRPGRDIVTIVRARPRDGTAAELSASGQDVGDAREGIPWVLDPGEFDRWLARVPAGVNEIGPVEEERERFVIRAVLDRGPDRLRIASFTIQKKTWDEWWGEVSGTLDAAPSGVSPSHQEGRSTPDVPSAFLPAAEYVEDTWENRSLDDAPDPRYSHTAVWTGSAMLVWGGPGISGGRRYDPATDTWTSIASVNEPVGRYGHAAVWTGELMVVWGGIAASGSRVNTGGRYDPATDVWSPTSLVDGPPGLYPLTGVWTDSLMVVWGQLSNNGTLTGGRYDPVSDSWMSIAAAGAPSNQRNPTGVWTGTRLLIWGGFACAVQCTRSNSGFQYDPISDTWSSISTLDAPSGRSGHSAVWTGREMIVWGGHDGAYANTGGRYDPPNDRWTPVSATNAPTGRSAATAIWSGTEMIVWGGNIVSPSNVVTYLDTGGRYDPTSDTWLPTSMMNAPIRRDSHTAVWDGRWMIVWGGHNDVSPGSNTGGRYDPSNDTWTPTSTGQAPAGRYLHTAVWTGVSMVVWGGFDGSPSLGTGGRYDPATDTWAPTSTSGAPSARYGHTAIWTGEEMIVWGGIPVLGTGARYDPATDAWTETALADAPSGRSGHTAVWTGSEMIVWGGHDGAFANTGGRYDPSSDSWTATSMTSAPTIRSGHTAVWTGSLMIVWGGGAGPQRPISGGRYDPVTDSWTPTTLNSAPGARSFHSSVWTGQLMVIWGGAQCMFDCPTLNTGGRYDPVNDVWTATSMTDAPAPRYLHTGVWTGNVMIVWSGNSTGFNPGPFPSNTGAAYHPETDSWAATSLLDAPMPRYGHTAVWMENEMIVWGGRQVGTPSAYVSSGGRYGPVVPTYYLDSDGDGHGDPNAPLRTFNPPPAYVASADDCSDTDSSSWGTPSEVRDLRLTDPITLAWSTPFRPGGVSLAYDSIRSSEPFDFISAATCVASDTPVLTCADDNVPVLGRIHFYLVRAQNGCPQGQGPAGSDSNGVSRDARSCP